MKEAVSTKDEAHKAMCQNSAEENKKSYDSMKNRAKKAVLKAMSEKSEEVLTELQNCPNWMFWLVRGRKSDCNERLRCMRGSDGKLCFNETERGQVWKDYLERIMNAENDWDRNVEGDAVEGPVVCVSKEGVLQALNEMEAGKVPGPSNVSLELITASGGVGIQVMAEICQKVLDGFGIPVELDPL